MKLPVYMDYHATTPVDPRVFEAMKPYFLEKFGNAASRSHAFGWEAQEAVERARQELASIIGAGPKEIVFTSGATESDNIAVRGAAERYRERGDHVITAAAEHSAILNSCKRLETQGFHVSYLPVDRFGMVDPDLLRRSITDRTILISIMFASNEIGTVNPVMELGRIARENGVLFHTDAAQAVAKVPVHVREMNIDLMSFTAHKMCGPKGVGALYIRGSDSAVDLAPISDGGGQERGLRSGTLNVPGIVGFGEACRIGREEMPAEAERLRRLRDRLKTEIFAELDEVYLNGHETSRLPGNLNVSFGDVEGETLLVGMSDVAVSSGAACAAAARAPSHVLRAIGLRDDLVQSSIRFGLGRFTTEAEVDYVAGRVVETARGLRELSPAYEAGRGGLARNT